MAPSSSALCDRRHHRAQPHAFRWTSTGGMQDIRLPPQPCRKAPPSPSPMMGPSSLALPTPRSRAARAPSAGPLGRHDRSRSAPIQRGNHVHPMSAPTAPSSSATARARPSAGPAPTGMVPISSPGSSSSRAHHHRRRLGHRRRCGVRRTARLLLGCRGLPRLSTRSSTGLLPAGWVCTQVNGISDDGRTFVGDGLHNGSTEGWIAALPAPCYANCDGSILPPILNVSDFHLLHEPLRGRRPPTPTATAAPSLRSSTSTTSPASSDRYARDAPEGRLLTIETASERARGAGASALAPWRLLRAFFLSLPAPPSRPSSLPCAARARRCPASGFPAPSRSTRCTPSPASS
jgi:hypothetical protein